MSTWLITHPDCLAHDTGSDHPERIERLEAVLAALEALEFDALARHEAESAPREALERAHETDYIDDVFNAIPTSGRTHFNADTVVSPGSGKAALRAIGAALQGVDAIQSGQARRVFCATRPPGHHAEPDESMGFCLFSNAAIAALHAQAVHGVQRVAVVDFDVHHGNGTQRIFSGRDGLFYLSLHQHPLFPGTGTRRENIPGNILNLPLPEGTGSAAYRQQFHGEAISALIDFDPELLIISAGFDAAAEDPLAGLELTADDFSWITDELVAVANYCCGGHVCSILEGGYDLGALSRGVARHVAGLMR
ncbi:histone deacetylase family protein [Spiribacter onubensis]|uniref:Histone deacetylase family protein n=1 Tax=Spiribacter onubensis TaxID=3122420 RepID=A0ABV3S9J9_9GAMM